MQIWVDADACPNVSKKILYRASHCLQIPLTLVANQDLNMQGSPLIRTCLLPRVLLSPMQKSCVGLLRAIW